MLGSVASSVFSSPVTPPYMSPWHSTPTAYMAMPQMMNEHDVSPIIAGMNGLGISSMSSSMPTGPHIPPDLHTHESRGTTYFTRKGQSNMYESHTSTTSSHRAEDSLGQSSHASILSPIHSREASVETSATSNQAGSLDIKTVDDSGSDGRAPASSNLAASVSSDSNNASEKEMAASSDGNRHASVTTTGLLVADNFGERGRAATSEAVLRSPRLSPPQGKKGFVVR